MKKDWKKPVKNKIYPDPDRGGKWNSDPRNKNMYYKCLKSLNNQSVESNDHRKIYFGVNLTVAEYLYDHRRLVQK